MDSDKAQVKLWRIVQEEGGISRRKAQELIASGEVDVNQVTALDPFMPVERDEIKDLWLRGHPLSLKPPKLRFYRYHKPTGVLCSHDDPHSGNTLGRLLRSEGFVGYTWAGRLDQDAEGLMLLTNDGDLVHRMTHPSFCVRKVYHVWVPRLPGSEKMRRIFSDMRHGIEDAGDVLRIVSGEIVGRKPHVVITIAEGRNHEIKRLFKHFDLTVVRLKRVALGPIKLGDLPAGAIARLDDEETATLVDYEESLTPTRRAGDNNVAII